MKRQLELLRLSAKILLALVLGVMVTGFLTAKPGLLGGSFTTYRWLHTRLMPLVFLPILFAHTTTGLLFLVSRSKRWNVPLVRRLVVGGWLAAGALLATLYLFEPSVPPVVLEEAVLGGGALEGAPPAADSPAVPPAGVDESASAEPSGAAPASTGAPAQPPSPPLAVETPVRAPGRPVVTASASVPTESSQPSAPKSPRLDSNAVVQSKCTACHGLDEVYAEPRSSAEWNEVLDRMVGHGADLSAAERAAVMRIMPRRR